MKERVYRFRAIEKRIAASRPGFCVLDVGCGRGDNLRRLVRYRGRAIGIEPNTERATEAGRIASALSAVGEHIPFADHSFDMVYISHVLHHAVDVGVVLAESHRVLKPGGCLFVIETIDDSPLMRLARTLQPSWDDDEVLNRFRYQNLVASIAAADFDFVRGEKFNWMYFAWELLPMAWRRLDLFAPFFIGLEVALHRPLGTHWGGHCWLVAEKAGQRRFDLFNVDRE